MKPKDQFSKIILILLLLVSLSGLVMYSIKGFTARYAQDDYCYGYRLNENGFFANQVYSYFQPTEYNGNRYALTFSYNIIELLGGPKFYPVVPALLIVLLTVAAAWFVFQLLPAQDSKHLTLLVALAASGFGIFFFFYLSFNLYQVLFWLSAQQTYLMPMVSYAIVMALLLRFSTVEKVKFQHYFLLGLVVFYAGGGSETPTVWFLTVIGMLLIYSWVKRDSIFSTQAARKLLLVTFGVTILATIVLAVSPTNGQSLRSTPSPILVAAKVSFGYAVDFLVSSIKSLPLPYAVVAVFGFFAARFVVPAKERRWTQSALTVLVGSVIVYLLCVVTMFPTMYAMSVYPGPRALITAQFTLLLFMIILGWEGERILRPLISKFPQLGVWSTVLVGIIGLMLSVYIGRAIYFEASDFSQHQARAQAWDMREEMIYDAMAEGQRDVSIPAFDSIYMITELTSDPRHWVNFCAAKYYGVDSLTAIENYQGIGVYPLGK